MTEDNRMQDGRAAMILFVCAVIWFLAVTLGTIVVFAPYAKACMIWFGGLWA